MKVSDNEIINIDIFQHCHWTVRSLTRLTETEEEYISELMMHQSANSSRRNVCAFL